MLTGKMQLFKNHKTIFSIVDEPPSWSDVDDSLESLSEPDEEEDMPDDKDSTGAADEEVPAPAEEEDDSDGDFFDAGDGAAIDDRVSSRTASKSGQSEGDTEEDPVGPMTPGPMNSSSPVATPDTATAPRKANAVSFSRTVSADDGDLDDEEWVDPTPIPATPLDAAPPPLPNPATPPPMMAKAKSSSSAKSRKRKEARAPVPFPSSAAEGTDDRPRRVPQMSTARGRDGGRTQSGGVKGVIAPEPGLEHEPEPEPGPAEPDEPDADADDF
jgi:cysteine protease ATG4